MDRRLHIKVTMSSVHVALCLLMSSSATKMTRLKGIMVRWLGGSRAASIRVRVIVARRNTHAVSAIVVVKTAMMRNNTDAQP